MDPIKFILLLIIACFVGYALTKGAAKRMRTFNQAPPTNQGAVWSLVVGEAVTDRYSLHILKNATSAELADAADDIPLGMIQNDSVDSTEVDAIPKGIHLLGIAPYPLIGIAGATIAIDEELVADLAAPGRVKKLPSSAGTYYVIGRAMTAATAGNTLSIRHEFPRKVVVS